MSNVVALAGELFNSVSRMATPPVPSDAHSLFPIAGLSDDNLSNPFVFGSASADRLIDFDLNEVLNGGMEAVGSGPPANWVDRSVAPGSVVRTTTAGEFHAGAAGMELASSTGDAIGAQDVRARAGERWNVTARIKSNGSAFVEIRVQCLETGKYLAAGGTWQTTPTYFLRSSTGGGSFTLVGPSAFTVETMSAVPGLPPTVTLRFSAVLETNSVTAWVDEFYAWPSWSFAGIWGHNLVPAIAVELYRGDTSPAATLETTFTVRRPTFHWSGISSGTIRDQRYVRLKTVGSYPAGIHVLNAIALGEFVLGQGRILAQNPKYGVEVRRIEAQDRMRMRLGDETVFLYSDDARRVWSAPYEWYSQTQLVEAQEELYLRTRNGAHSMVWLPDDTNPREVIYGRFASPETGEVQDLLTLWKNGGDMTIEGQPFPTWDT